MNFLPEDYTPPSTSSNYTKLQQGDNTLRILSKPIIGWEMWINGHPKRYRYDQKPEATEESVPREFWAMVVWNRDSERLQVFHVTQGSIKKTLRELVADDMWGSPHQYDIKITRSGQQLKTNYSVTPRPKTPIDNHIEQAFLDAGINLEALFTNDDPFAEWTQKTAPLWVSKPKDASGVISKAQYDEIMLSIGDDIEYIKRMSKGLQDTFGCTLDKLPVKHYDAVLRQVKAHNAQRIQKELDDALPF